MEKIVVQRMKVGGLSDRFLLAERYYSILSAVNDLHLTEREIQLIAFTVIKGNLSDVLYRKEFCEKYGSTFPTLNNIVSKLKQKNILIKDKKILVNPVIVMNFDLDVTLTIKLLHEATISSI